MDLGPCGADTAIRMTPEMVSQRLRLARVGHEADLDAFARLIGIRVDHVRAIEEGAFSELPAGIYGRSAVKAYAAACGLDAAEILGDAEPFLVSLDDPIVGLARLKGLRRPTPPVPAAAEPVNLSAVRDADGALMIWRPLAAALIDAMIVTALLLLVVLAAVTALLVPISALGRSSPAFGMMGVFLAAGYFLCFGGVGGATVGERLMHVIPPPRHRDTVTLRAVGERALQSASEDVRCLCGLGARVGRWLALPPRAAYGNDVSGR